MNDNAKQWVEALRSGDFQQTVERLRNEDNEYCCLGVACELYRVKVGGEWLGEAFLTATGDLMEDAELPREVGEWLGLRARGDFQNDSLIEKNDTDRLTFAEIADIIESKPTGLFA